MRSAGQRSRTAPITRLMPAGVAQAIVSASDSVFTARSCAAAMSWPSCTRSSTVATGMSPAKLQPNTAMIEMPSTGMPFALRIAICACCTRVFSARSRFWLRRMKGSEVQSDMVPRSDSRSLCAIARSSPCSLSHSAV